MKIAIMINQLRGGGAERVCCNLANFLVRKGHRVKIMTLTNEPSAYAIDKRVDLYSLTGSHNDIKQSKKRYIKWIRRMRLFLKSDDSNIYIVMLPLMTILTMITGGLTNKPIIMTERCYPAEYSLGVRYALKKLCKKADGYVFQTRDAKEWYSEYMDVSAAVIIPNAINEDFLEYKRYCGERRKEIVAVGRLNQQKNYGLLLKAFKLLCDQVGGYSLSIYGDGSEKSNLESIALSLGILEQVKFKGFVFDIAQQIHDAALYVISSDYEGMPNSLMEAMALGLPCVSTDCKGGGAKYLIENGENGLIVPRNDANALASAMLKVISDDELSIKLGTNAAKVSDQLAPDRIYSEWEKYIEKQINIKAFTK